MRYRPRTQLELPRDVWLVESGALVRAFGSGLALPFLLIYLHNVRGIGLAPAGLVIAVEAFAAMAASVAVGPLVDQAGARSVLATSLLVSAVGFVGFVFVSEPWHGFLAACVSGVGMGAFWPSQSSLIAALTAGVARQSAYALQRVVHNLGIGLGGAVGGFIATTERPVTYTVLLLANAASAIAYTGILAFVAPAPSSRAASGSRRGYRAVVSDKAFIAFMALNTALVSLGITLLQDVLPAYAKNEAGVSETGIGLVFLANTLVIVVVQLPLAKALAGRRRMGGYAIEALLWAVSWSLVFAAGVWLDGAGAAVVLAAAVSVFAVGECFHGAILGPMIADMAKPGLLGRYVAFQTLTHQMAWFGGRAVGGVALAVAADELWLAATVLALVCAGGALRVERALPAHLRRAPASETAAGGAVNEPSPAQPVA